MKSRISWIVAALLAAAAAVSAQVTFVQQPAMVSSGASQWTITFEVSANTDVEVSIVNPQDSTVVRHLAAGVLGANPPQPFTANALAQTLVWDGKDDFGKLAVNPGNLRVRVRAGMTPRLAALVGENLYDNSGTISQVADVNGNVYKLKSSGQTPFLRKYDASGNYIKTLFPPPADLPADSVKSYKVNVLPGGGWVPKTYPVIGMGVFFTNLNLKGATIVRMTPDRKLLINGKSGQHLVDTNGCFTDTAYNPVPMKALAGGGKTRGLSKALAPFREGPFVFERITVDRRNEHVYWNMGDYITDWNNPVPGKLPVDIDNITISPDGYLYGWTDKNWSATAGGWALLARHLAVPPYSSVPYANTQNQYLTGAINFQWGYAGTFGNHKGVAVGWQGQVAAFTEANCLFQVPDTGGNLTAGGWDSPPVGNCTKLVTEDPGVDKNYAREGLMGVKYDPAGNFYVGVRTLQGPIVPAGFGMDPAFRNIGAVVKFRSDATAVHNPVTKVVTNYEKIYPQPYGPFTMPANGWDPYDLGDAACTCRNSYFDVDPYGRLYIPNGVTCQIYVADNAGNNISVFGGYGNTDSRGGLSGPGQLIATPDIPLAWPTSVGTSEDFIYIGDLVNARLVRVQMVYALDNLPGLTEHVGAPQKAAALANPRLSARPNPFIPVSHITLSLPAASPITLKVYNANGRLVRSLAAGDFGAGTHRFSWDARDAKGRHVAAGVYVYKLTAGKRVLLKKVVLAK